MGSRRDPRGGRGSNQYQAKPSGRRDEPEGRAGQHVDRLTPDDVAWAFNPDRDAWADKAGMVTWADAHPWIEAGFTATATGLWFSRGPHVAAEEARAWVDAGFGDPFAVRQWRVAGFGPTEAAGWRAAGFEYWEGAAGLRDAGLSIEQAAAVWDEAGFTVELRSLSRRFPDPVECRKWLDWIDEHYPDDERRYVVLYEASEFAQALGPDYDFDQVAVRVTGRIRPNTPDPGEHA